MATIAAVRPGRFGFPVSIRKQYQNYIGGEWIKPTSNTYLEDLPPDHRRSAAPGQPGRGLYLRLPRSI